MGKYILNNANTLSTIGTLASSELIAIISYLEVILEYVKRNDTTLLFVATLAYVFLVHKQVKFVDKDSKYQKLAKEFMLVSKLHFNKNDLTLFDDTRITMRPSRDDEEWRVHWGGYFRFWDEICEQMYLTTPDLYLAFDEFHNAKVDYWEARQNSWTINFHATLEGAAAVDEFTKKKDKFIEEIDKRYNELIEELKKFSERR
jgi:hypothetical protein